MSLDAPDEVVLFVHRGSEVLVVHRSPAQGGYWHVIAGTAEPSETGEETARRELHEETGLAAELGESVEVIEHADPLDEERPLAADDGGVAVRIRCFRVEAPDGWEPTLDWEHDAHDWCAPADAAALLRWPEVRAALDRLFADRPPEG